MEKELMEKIKLIICAEERVDPNTVFTHTRQRAIKEARQIIAYFCRKYILGANGKPLSLELIGDFVGLDHATIIHTCKTIDGWIATNREFRERMEVHDKNVKDYSGLYSLDVALLLAKKVMNQMQIVKKEYKLLNEIIEKLGLERFN